MSMPLVTASSLNPAGNTGVGHVSCQREWKVLPQAAQVRATCIILFSMISAIIGVINVQLSHPQEDPDGQALRS